MSKTYVIIITTISMKQENFPETLYQMYKAWEKEQKEKREKGIPAEEELNKNDIDAMGRDVHLLSMIDSLERRVLQLEKAITNLC